MTRAGWIRIGAFLIALLALAGALVLAPGTAHAQTFVFGYLNECSQTGPPNPISDANVSLIDAQGANPTLIAKTEPGGSYTFSPPTGTYLLAFSAKGYYDNSTTTPFRFDGSRNVRNDACLDRMPPRTISFSVHVQNVGSTPLMGASVRLYDTIRDQVVASNTTNISGDAVLSIWAASLELQVSRTSYQPSATTVNTATASSTVTLQNGVFVLGHAVQTDGLPIKKGVVAFLYNLANLPPFQKIIRANVTSDGLYNFTAIPATYRMIVDADGYTASVTTFNVPSTSPPGFVDRALSPSPPEVANASFVLDRTDWNSLTVYRNLTLNADSSIPGLKIPFIRSVDLQVDFTFGNGDGVVQPSEWADFEAWLDERGTFYVTTDRVYLTPENAFDVQGRYYNSTSQATPTATPTGEKVLIKTSGTYAVRGTAIPNGGKTYTVNLNMTADTNTTVYRNQVYVVNLPTGYEMAEKTTSGTVTTTGWTAVTVDPGLGLLPRIKMTVEESEGGVARAMVTGPPGKFYALNGTLDNYTAIISAETNITFSARQSTDPVGNILEANFTWRFDNTSRPNDAAWIRHGIDTTFNYTSGGLFAVNLTVVETGLNVSYRDFTLYVDDVDPVAQVRSNRTSGNANGTTLRLPQDIEVRFDGSYSTDVIYTGSTVPGVIFDGVSTPQSGYAWDFDGNGIADSFEKQPRYTWTKPGTYTANLTVTDSIGHKGVNATLTVIVNDTVAPVPRYAILDPSNGWVSPPVSMIEGKTYFFNASTTTDNYDNVTALNFTWTVEGPANITPYGNPSQIQTIPVGANGTVYGMNISIQWIEFNSSYVVKLNVTDTGFDWMNPAKRNSAVVLINNVVQFDAAARPNLQIAAGSLKVNPLSPEEGAAVNVTVEVLNQPNRGNASHVIARLSQTEPAPTVLLSSTPQWYSDKWAPLGTTVEIPSGKSVFAVFTIRFPLQGPKTIQVQVNDTYEPWTQVDGANRATTTVNVVQAGWVLPLVIGGSIAGIVAIGVGLRYRSKIRSGALSFRRKKKEAKEGEEEAEEEEAEEEEKPQQKKRL